MNVDFFDLYHAVVKSLPWPEEIEKWGETKPSRKHALEALRKLGAQGVSSMDKLDPLIERIIKDMQSSRDPLQRDMVQRSAYEARNERELKEAMDKLHGAKGDKDAPKHVGFAKPDDDDKQAGKPLPEPGHAKGHH